uniref:Uncharacterized protein n=1 Tax=Microcebus murinus TaxID=30608 RepID=A0A8C5VYA3_MICMU
QPSLQQTKTPGLRSHLKPAEVQGKFVKKETLTLLQNIMSSFIQHGPTISRRTDICLPDSSSNAFSASGDGKVSKNQKSNRLSEPSYRSRSLTDVPQEYEVNFAIENGDSDNFFDGQRRWPLGDRAHEDYRYYEYNHDLFQRMTQNQGRHPSGIGRVAATSLGNLTNHGSEDLPLPPGGHPLEQEGLSPRWERVESSEFGTYYVDHTNKAQYRHPCSPSISQYDQPPPVTYQPQQTERNQSLLVPENPYHTPEIPDWLQVYARAPVKYDHILKWELFQLADLDTYQGMLKLLLKMYKAYRQALLSELENHKQRQQ